jgi:hypothetical protein
VQLAPDQLIGANSDSLWPLGRITQGHAGYTQYGRFFSNATGICDLRQSVFDQVVELKIRLFDIYPAATGSSFAQSET